jgi:hypothetical protein
MSFEGCSKGILTLRGLIEANVTRFLWNYDFISNEMPAKLLDVFLRLKLLLEVSLFHMIELAMALWNDK